MIADTAFPPEIAPDIGRGRRLAWWTLGSMATVLVVMWLTAGSSAAMRAALIEDVLSLVPATVFLISTRYEAKPRNRRFRFGYKRVNSLAFLIAAVTLLSVGGFLVYEGLLTLLSQEHPTVGGVTLFGHTIWLGWMMIAALMYSAIPPMIIGRLKQPVARRIQDKVLHTDALMQKADWMTALAGIAGIAGIGFGLWWADATAALLIALSIVRDGAEATRQSVAELVDGVPLDLDDGEMATDAVYLEQQLVRLYPGADIRLREAGRYILADVCGAIPAGAVPPSEVLMPEGRAWRLAEVSFVPSPD